MISFTYLEVPVGKMIAAVSNDRLCLFDFLYRKNIDKIINRIETYTGEKLTEKDHPLFRDLSLQINEYFAGERKEFSLPLHFAGSSFQQTVWNALLTIPYGQTRTYEEQSIYLKNEKAIRAVATANGQNGIAIIVPCHRVIGKDGNLTGYAGGLPTKKRLLDLEKKYSGIKSQSELF